MTQPTREKARAFSDLTTCSFVLASVLALASCSDPVTAPSDLGDGVWKLASMEPAGASAFVPDDPQRFTVEFQADGRIGVTADCNRCGGSYSLSDGTLTVPALACTRVACPTPHGDRFAGMIDGSSSIERDGDSLEIQSADGILRLRR
jgi:heat shock protein HslJ